jgi:hypothetical protein
MNQPEIVTLREVYRQEGRSQSWHRVRMSELMVGDVFRIAHFTDQWRVMEPPWQQPDGVWSVQAKHLGINPMEMVDRE